MVDIISENFNILTTNTSINGNTTRSLCSGKCEVQMVGGAKVDVTGAKKVTIKDGKFVVTR